MKCAMNCTTQTTYSATLDHFAACSHLRFHFLWPDDSSYLMWRKQASRKACHTHYTSRCLSNAAIRCTGITRIDSGKRCVSGCMVQLDGLYNRHLQVYPRYIYAHIKLSTQKAKQIFASHHLRHIICYQQHDPQHILLHNHIISKQKPLQTSTRFTLFPLPSLPFPSLFPNKQAATRKKILNQKTMYFPPTQPKTIPTPSSRPSARAPSQTLVSVENNHDRGPVHVPSTCSVTCRANKGPRKVSFPL